MPDRTPAVASRDPAPRGGGLLLGIVVGIVAGVLLGGWLPDVARRFELLGEVFLNLLMMLVIPLVVLSMVVGISGLGDIRRLGSMGWRTVVYYLGTTCIAVILGLVCVNLVQPGVGVSPQKEVAAASASPQDTDDEGEGTASQPDRAKPDKRGPPLPTETDAIAVVRQIVLGDPETGRQGLVPRNPVAAMANFEILPLILFSLLLGAALSTMGERARSTLQVFETLNAAVMRLVHWVMRVAPIGIFGLVAARIGEAGGFAGFGPQLLALGKYAGTVALGLGLHAFIVLPLLLWFLGRRGALKYARGVAPALLSAASTSSSSAALPLTLDGVRRTNGVSARAANFVLPLGATINMDGTALYEAVAAVFVAQVYGIELTAAMQAIIVLTATLAAIGAAGIPEAGLVTMVIVLEAVGLPLEGIGLLLTIDWLLDRARTTVNVWGDSVGAAVIERLTPDGEGADEVDADGEPPG